MFPTYYVINYIYTIDDIVQSKISSKAYDNICLLYTSPSPRD